MAEPDRPVARTRFETIYEEHVTAIHRFVYAG